MSVIIGIDPHKATHTGNSSTQPISVLPGTNVRTRTRPPGPRTRANSRVRRPGPRLVHGGRRPGPVAHAAGAMLLAGNGYGQAVVHRDR